MCISNKFPGEAAATGQGTTLGEPALNPKESRDFPGGAVVKNPPANAAGHGFDPWSRKIPHATEQLSP